eukprot:5948971-Amphidinium_carterae.1
MQAHARRGLERVYLAVLSASQTHGVPCSSAGSGELASPHRTQPGRAHAEVPQAVPHVEGPHRLNTSARCLDCNRQTGK